MNAVSLASNVVRLIDASYEALQISGGKTYPVRDLNAASLDEAMTQAITNQLFHHKDHLAIRETTERGTKLHIFAVKRKSTPRYEYRDYQTRRVHDHYLAPVCTIDEQQSQATKGSGLGAPTHVPAHKGAKE